MSKPAAHRPCATRLHLGRLRPRDTCLRSGHHCGLEHGRTSEDARLLACLRLTCVLARFICVPTRCSRSHFGRNTSRIDYSDTGAPVQGRRSPGSTSMVSHANVRHHAGLACSHYNIAARPFIRCGCRRSVAPEKRIPTTPRRRRKMARIGTLAFNFRQYAGRAHTRARTRQVRSKDRAQLARTATAVVSLRADWLQYRRSTTVRSSRVVLN